MFKESRRGTVTVADNGATHFETNSKGHHKFVSINKKQARELQNHIVELCEQYERDRAVLKGKTLVTCGDSFTEGDFWDYIDLSGKNDKSSPEIYDKDWNCYMTIPYWIAKRNSMKLINMAKCGSMIGFPEKQRNCEVFVQDKLYNLPKDADYILFKFGINDSWHMPLGEVNDTEPTTFCGAWNTVLSYLKKEFPSAKVGVIASNYCKAAEWGFRVEDICQKYSIPCLNEESDAVPYFYGQKFKKFPKNRKERIDSTYCCGINNGHPNVDAHKNESHIEEKFLLSL